MSATASVRRTSRKAPSAHDALCIRLLRADPAMAAAIDRHGMDVVELALRVRSGLWNADFAAACNEDHPDHKAAKARLKARRLAREEADRAFQKKSAAFIRAKGQDAWNDVLRQAHDDSTRANSAFWRRLARAKDPAPFLGGLAAPGKARR